MQRAFGRWLFWRWLGFFGHHGARRCGHHGADVGGFGLSLAAAVHQIGGSSFLDLLGFGLLVFVRLHSDHASFLLGGSGCGGLSRRRDSGRGSFGRHAFGFGLGFAGLLGFALQALLRQLFFLATQQLGLATCIFFASGQFFVINDRHRLRSRGRLGLGHHVLVALNEGAFFAHLHLDRAGTTGGIGLLDLAGGLLHQGDLFSLAGGGAVAGFEVVEQGVFVRLRDGIGLGFFAHAGRAELLQQNVGGLVQLGGQFGYCVTGHWVLSPLGPPLFTMFAASRHW